MIIHAPVMEQTEQPLDGALSRRTSGSRSVRFRARSDIVSGGDHTPVFASRKDRMVSLNVSLDDRSSWGRIPLRPTDRFGFFLVPADADAASPLATKEAASGSSHANFRLVSEHARAQPDPDKYESRTRKWLAMLAHWERYTAAHPVQLKRRVRKGIPDELRCTVWPLLCGANKLVAANPGLYDLLVAATPARSDMICIALDLPRTYPNHFMFSTDHIDAAPATPASALLPDAALSIGQRALRNVLRAFACHSPKVGYCQGMAFLAGLLLTYLPEENAFWVLVALMESEKHGLAGVRSAAWELCVVVYLSAPLCDWQVCAAQQI